MKGNPIAMPETKYDKTSEINFRFGKDSKVQPKGMEKLTPAASVTVVLKGTIKSFSTDDWDKSKRFSLDMKSCEILLPDGGKEQTILDAALTQAKKALKKVE